jgi:hypothetical protein
MPRPEESVKRSFRDVLADSHVAAVAIGVLLLWSLKSGVQAFERPLFHFVYFLVNVVAIRGIPYGSGSFTSGEWLEWLHTFTDFLSAVTCFAVCWFVSRWVYGVGPFRSLSTLRMRLARRNDA